MPDAGSSKLAIAGPPLSGKTTCGRILAELLRIEFIDLDAEIVKEGGRAIRKIFEEEGEACFRQIESHVLGEVLTRPGRAVIALGGGTLLDPGNLALVLGKAFLLSLHESPAELEKRLDGEDRPLVFDQESIAVLLEERKGHYLSLPNRIDCTGLTPQECAQAAMAALESSAGGLDERRL